MPPTSLDDSRALVALHENGMDPARRRALGAHYTPAPLARRIVQLAFDELGRMPRMVLDPSCGGGAVLLAAADELVRRGLDPADALTRIAGQDIDADSLEVAREALRRWADENGAMGAGGAQLSVADALTGRPLPAEVDVVVGNPPFSSPLDSTHGAKPGAGRPGAYTDSSALHLLAAVEGVGSGAVVCLLQPQSVLGARDAAPVRESLARTTELCALWATDEQPFDAAVEVCAPVLRRVEEGPHRPTGATKVSLLWRDTPARPISIDSAGSWSPLLAAALGVPPAAHRDRSSMVSLGERAHCTAGFRDEFYALAAAARDLGPDNTDPAGDARLVTSGMIDPGELRWGQRPRRLAGNSVLRPVVALDDLEAESTRVAQWSRRRLVPKLLVASQTRVIEAVCDTEGDCIPVTPVVSVEPLDDDTPLALLAAVLSAPSSSARLALEVAGTGRSSAALRISASALESIAVPTDPTGVRDAVSAWQVLCARRASPGGRSWEAVGRRLDRALGFEDPDVVQWWASRLPGRARVRT